MKEDVSQDVADEKIGQAVFIPIANGGAGMVQAREHAFARVQNIDIAQHRTRQRGRQRSLIRCDVEVHRIQGWLRTGLPVYPNQLALLSVADEVVHVAVVSQTGIIKAVRGLDVARAVQGREGLPGLRVARHNPYRVRQHFSGQA